MAGTPQTTAALLAEIINSLPSGNQNTAATLRQVLSDIVASGNIGTVQSGFVLGNNTGNVGPVVTLSPSQVLDMISPTTASILYRSGSGWVAQPALATISAAGLVQPDGVTITVNGSGVVSAAPATISTLGVVRPDNITVTVNGSGVLTVSASPVLLATLTTSGSTTPSLSDTTHITGTYSLYKIVLENIVPQTTQQPLQLQVHSGGAFKNTGYLTNVIYNTGSGFTVSVTTTTFIPLNINSALNSNSSNAAPGISGEVNLYNPSASAICMIDGRTNWITSTGATSSFGLTNGFWNTAGVVDGFQISFASGNITSGTVKIYGYP